MDDRASGVVPLHDVDFHAFSPVGCPGKLFPRYESSIHPTLGKCQ